VQRERARIDSFRPPPEPADAEPIGRLLDGVMKRLGLDSQQWLTSMAAEWSAVVGDAVARHTRPGRYEERTLIVFVDSSVWLSELKRYGQDKILVNVQRRAGADRVRAVSLQMDPDGGRPPRDADRRGGKGP
jgi:predicted nucleic acid-binding Zn ribbon protein